MVVECGEKTEGITAVVYMALISTGIIHMVGVLRGLVLQQVMIPIVELPHFLSRKFKRFVGWFKTMISHWLLMRIPTPKVYYFLLVLPRPSLPPTIIIFRITVTIWLSKTGILLLKVRHFILHQVIQMIICIKLILAWCKKIPYSP